MSHFQQEIRAHEPLVCGTLKFELAKRMPWWSISWASEVAVDRSTLAQSRKWSVCVLYYNSTNLVSIVDFKQSIEWGIYKNKKKMKANSSDFH